MLFKSRGKTAEFTSIKFPWEHFSMITRLCNSFLAILPGPCYISVSNTKEDVNLTGVSLPKSCAVQKPDVQWSEYYTLMIIFCDTLFLIFFVFTCTEEVTFAMLASQTALKAQLIDASCKGKRRAVLVYIYLILTWRWAQLAECIPTNLSDAQE